MIGFVVSMFALAALGGSVLMFIKMLESRDR
ncbi:hypothetical protein HMPREF2087_00253 [Helicobacter canis NCTC 12740]|uniref:Uncharacterized protein n=1 Tax=Helicobacter canis NCTC 12740 TaxID=1357399 RepID=V8CKQ3_9HELI|nr:hypothetical protein HMPREF2087_00253 [Helicobacter canis NCTC 12740]